MAWTLLVRNGTVVDPSQKIHRIADVAIAGDRVAEVGTNLDAKKADRVIDARGKIVTPGFIDLHTHNYVSKGGRPSLEVDSTSLAFGSTTVLDAGTATPQEFPHYWETDIQDAKTRMYALVRMPDPYGPTPANVGETAKTIGRYENLIGVKFHHSQHFASLPLAREAADFAGGILMAEAYGAPIPQLLQWLNPGDILTHTFHASFRFPLFDHKGKLMPSVWEAVERGVYLEIGHGARGFAFRTMEQALEQGLKPSTISTDVHVGNVDGPVYDMPTTMSKLLALGMSLDDVIEMSTSIPAKALHRGNDLGTLKPGAVADVVVSELAKGEHVYLDVLHEKRTGKERILPQTVIYGGKVYDGPKYSPGKMSHKGDAPPGFIENT
jgi:dihydroorotase